MHILLFSVFLIVVLATFGVFFFNEKALDCDWYIFQDAASMDLVASTLVDFFSVWSRRPPEPSCGRGKKRRPPFGWKDDARRHTGKGGQQGFNGVNGHLKSHEESETFKPKWQGETGQLTLFSAVTSLHFLRSKKSKSTWAFWGHMPSGYVGLPCVRRRGGEDGEGNTFGSPTFLASDEASVEICTIRLVCMYDWSTLVWTNLRKLPLMCTYKYIWYIYTHDIDV